MLRTILLSISLHLCIAPDLPAAAIDFVRDVQPILKQRCYACHGAKTQRSGLRLDIKSEAFKGGELYGAGIVPGQPGASPLYQFLADDKAELRMPPEGDRLPPTEVRILREWITQGANWPEGVDPAQLDDPADHWSFKPLAASQPPAVKAASWPRNQLDCFVLARLEQQGLSPAPEAGRVAWLRRVSFDLIGLPPTYEQVEAFVADEGADAYVRVVERLLSSPRYGERWAQHWLDVVRYADTHGFEVNTERPNAWPYRDYVIKSFNDDTPYDQFIREQIVGDALGIDAATGFLVTASVLLPGQIGKDEASIRLARQDALDEVIANIGQSFLGLSIGCARCHNHKFDPISQRDYYSMQAFVAGVEYADRELRTSDHDQRLRRAATLRTRIAEINRQLARQAPLAGSNVVRPMINARENVDRFSPVTTRRIRFTIEQTNHLEPCIDELEVFNTHGENVALANRGAKVTASGSRVARNRHELRLVNDGRYGNSSSWLSDQAGSGWLMVELPEATNISCLVWGRDREGKFSDRLATAYRIEVEQPDGTWQVVADARDRQPGNADNKQFSPYASDSLSVEQTRKVDQWHKQRNQLANELAAVEQPELVFAGKFRQPDEIRILSRGSPELPKARVVPAVLSVLDNIALPADAGDRLRRQTLADWIASPDNPLTARVIVNRIWLGHFGAGLVKTPNDFGRNGVAPSHPEMLDWLSAEFIRSGWSIKQMHRLIVLSATYRQASQHHERAASNDAEVSLLWRYPLRRLDGETIRDSILAINGRLNLEMGGPGFDLFDKRGGLTGFKPVERFSEAGLRRMIYAHKVRRERDAVFGAFDCPDAGQSAPQRRESTTAIQALNLFNSPFVIEQSAVLAQRVISQVGDDPVQQIRQVYRLALSRDPHTDELADAQPVVEQYGLAMLCRALLNSNEFLFIP